MRYFKMLVENGTFSQTLEERCPKYEEQKENAEACREKREGEGCCDSWNKSADMYIDLKVFELFIRNALDESHAPVCKKVDTGTSYKHHKVAYQECFFGEKKKKTSNAEMTLPKQDLYVKYILTFYFQWSTTL